MPPLSSEILNKHQNTLIHNLPEVARALNREPNEIMKFFTLETSTRFRHSSDHHYVLSGRHSANELQRFLSQYLDLYVLCPGCSLPDTFYKIKISSSTSSKAKSKAEKVSLVCQVCGLKSECDREHKLTSFISKQFQKMRNEKGSVVRAEAAVAEAEARDPTGEGSVEKQKKKTKNRNQTLSS
jgi:translation initiation factor 5